MKVIDEIKVKEKQQQILDIAEEIILQSGIEGLSIRKIAKVLNQTPGIIYHYFENKEEIIRALVQRGYQEIIAIINQEVNSNDFETIFKSRIVSYMKAMITHKDVFLLLLQSKDPKIQEATFVLSLKELDTRESMKSLLNTIEKGIQLGIFKSIENIEVYVKLLWCSLFGIIERIIIEEIPTQEAELYIEASVVMILRGLKAN